MSAASERELIERELAQCMVTPRQLAHLRWLVAEYRRGDTEMKRLVAETIRDTIAGLLEEAPRRLG